LHRSHTDYVVTEWGHARLTGLTVRERTKVLISIAHPKFRDELTAKAKQMGYLY
ncbi:MAG TPA: acetyl-CoA hydrolase/transferase C-terminal domain-containing protein, partial [Tenuifilaceae bacterium]|nr:acetyl-CoA hydrolase/transferase C-terminal domain-containing protein [Tenuifilaceae bacterium]